MSLSARNDLETYLEEQLQMGISERSHHFITCVRARGISSTAK